MRPMVRFAATMVAAGVLTAACGGANYSSNTSGGIPVDGVSIPSSMSLRVGETGPLVATLTPADASDRRITWTSDHPGIATVTTAGVVTALAQGTATITARTVDGGKTATCEVTVGAEGRPATGIALDPSRVSVGVGSPVTMVATVLPLDASKRDVTWTASNGNVALEASSSSVKITGVAIGTTTVTAKTVDGGHTASAEVTVVPINVTAVNLSSTTLALTTRLSATLTAIVSPANATDQTVTWTSSDPTVATVTPTTPGAITATVLGIAPGKASVSVTTNDGRKSDLCAVTVKAAEVPTVAVTGVALNRLPTAVLALEAGAPGTTGTVVATVTPDTATNKEVNWTSSDPQAVSLSATTGSEVTLTGLKPGASTITATTADGAKTATTGVKVWLLDAEIAATTAAALTAGAGGTYSTKSAGGAYVERTLDKLIYYGAENAFSPGDSADGGILLNEYASGSRTYAAAVGDSAGLAGMNTVVQVNSYLAVPGARLANVASPSVKVTVTAKQKSGSPRVALWSQGRVVGVSDVLPANGVPGTSTFDGVPAAQINVFDGGLEGSSLYVEAIRIEPSATPVPDVTPPGDVTNLTTTNVSGSSLTLSWTNPTDADLDGVRITYGSPPVSVTLPSTRTSFTADNLTPGVGYSFWIRTVDKAGHASNGVTYVRKGADPLLDETVSPGVDVAYVDTVANANTGTLVSVPGSKLQYFARTAKTTALGHFKAYDGKFMFVESTVDPANSTTNSVALNPKAYVVIPAAYTVPPSAAFPSVRIIVKASQYYAQLGLNLLLLDGTPPPHSATTGPKVLSNVQVPAGASAGAATSAFVFDGLPPNAQYKIGCDYKQMFLIGVRVEPSTRSPGTPTVTVQ